ncbi:MAG: hypothetical protein LBO73_03920 [Holosporaceae bacterium]|jgi:hypothetical protein|nr:hypothetical protein [Holosporaceae bacterium]
MRKAIASFALIAAVLANADTHGMETGFDFATNAEFEKTKSFDCHPLYSKCFDEICNNFVGKIAMKLLLTMLITQEKILHLGVGDHNGFDAGENVITINPDYFTEGLAKYTLCGVLNGEIVEKHETISEAVFRELCRALHEYAGTKMEGTRLLDSIYGDRPEKILWVNDENV